jgi:hypothetical protein
MNRPGNLRHFPASRNTAFHILPVTSRQSHCDVFLGDKTFRSNKKILASQGYGKDGYCLEQVLVLTSRKKALGYSVVSTITTSAHTRLQIARF